MRVPSFVAAVAALALATGARAVEVVVKNDSVTDFGAAVIVSGFVTNERAASVLTSPCNGNVRAAQVFWRSLNGTAAPEFGRSIFIARAGVFPQPGIVQQSILGPVMTDGVVNEFRWLDENNTIPVNVPVTLGENFVVAFEFDSPPPAIGPSVVRDVDGCQAGRNMIQADFGGTLVWVSSCSLGVGGDWVIRAVVDCPATVVNANLAITKTAVGSVYAPGGTVAYTIVATNAGPSGANGASVTDTFPATLTNVGWTCTAAGGGMCGAPTGSGNIVVGVNLPVGATATFQASAIVAPDATGTIVNNAAISPPPGTSDPDTTNNLAGAVLQPDPVFANGFE
ncbi:MAG TPA: DUF11 domain-containing protein [Xanthomonadales bacterium]|nr:DUF11 domain-containing protein [Xanthomonadales bacterium]